MRRELCALRIVVLGAAALFLAAAPPCPDLDLDGYSDCTVDGCDPRGRVCGDCSDADSRIRPGAEESCNHVDDDCDGQVDETRLSAWNSRKVVPPDVLRSESLGTSIAILG